MKSFDKIVATDVDGTLFNSERSVSDKDLDTLRKLRSDGICTVLATGRSIWSFTKLAGSDFPVDYLVFSCGAGVMDWQKKEVIYRTGIEDAGIAKVKKYLNSISADYCIHDAIPDNHRFFIYRTNKENPDFDSRVNSYIPFIKEKDDITSATQFLAVFRHGDHSQLIADAERVLGDEFQIIRSTSPMDKKSLWMEIYAKGVSKAVGIEQIAELYKVGKNNIMAIGNDYNDEDMLKWAGRSYVVSNSPHELKERYITVPSNDESGFSKAVDDWLND